MKVKLSLQLSPTLRFEGAGSVGLADTPGGRVTRVRAAASSELRGNSMLVFWLGSVEFCGRAFCLFLSYDPQTLPVNNDAPRLFKNTCAAESS